MIKQREVVLLLEGFEMEGVEYSSVGVRVVKELRFQMTQEDIQLTQA